MFINITIALFLYNVLFHITSSLDPCTSLYFKENQLKSGKQPLFSSLNVQSF